ncbi:unnamed protein product [Kuraishia capsulata CBS 1993]|uniref:Signal recognition particle SEC65 subunit n=1 Tax=Kuraishia capsulata CBS 1993 TaxID=1382522 RepID=W6MMB8_9ASCO|nr:uncharacterized protein KUCA_T00003703001 [Kuraishia capsulata CBS 1993]CDK27724.1 unnamed protein product [Kuraishia capsulata CBS 1993]
MPILEEIEDVQDIDDLDMDIAEFDPTLRTPIAPARPQPTVVKSDPTPNFPQFEDIMRQMQSGGMPDMGMSLGNAGTAIEKESIINPEEMDEEQMAEMKALQIIYPCYFDKNRSVGDGRRVNQHNAVNNPLAKTLLDACRSLNVPCILEPEKSHPQDFGNPGRVRVALRANGIDGVKVYTKRQLMAHISTYLQQHETKLTMVKQLPGPPDLAQYQPETIPKVKGWNMNSIVPLHSPFLMKNPATKSIYEKEPTPPPTPKPHKEKIQRIRA